MSFNKGKTTFSLKRKVGHTRCIAAITYIEVESDTLVLKLRMLSCKEFDTVSKKVEDKPEALLYKCNITITNKLHEKDNNYLAISVYRATAHTLSGIKGSTDEYIFLVRKGLYQNHRHIRTESEIQLESAVL